MCLCDLKVKNTGMNGQFVTECQSGPPHPKKRTYKERGKEMLCINNFPVKEIKQIYHLVSKSGY